MIDSPHKTTSTLNNVTALTQISALIDKSRLCEHLKVSPRTIENMVKAGTFPPPVRVGKYVYWSEVAVRAWQRRLFSAQEAWTGHQSEQSNPPR